MSNRARRLKKTLHLSFKMYGLKRKVASKNSSLECCVSKVEEADSYNRSTCQLNVMGLLVYINTND